MSSLWGLSCSRYARQLVWQLESLRYQLLARNSPKRVHRWRPLPGGSPTARAARTHRARSTSRGLKRPEAQCLVELELPHLYKTVARNSPKRKELETKWDTGFQVPYLEVRPGWTLTHASWCALGQRLSLCLASSWTGLTARCCCWRVRIRLRMCDLSVGRCRTPTRARPCSRARRSSG